MSTYKTLYSMVSQEHDYTVEKAVQRDYQSTIASQSLWGQSRTTFQCVSEQSRARRRRERVANVVVGVEVTGRSFWGFVGLEQQVSSAHPHSLSRLGEG